MSAAEMSFTVHGEPVSKARARFTGYGHTSRAYTPAKTLDAEKRMAWEFKSAGGRFEPDKEATFGVRVMFHNGTRQRRDVDNMIKLVLDALNGVAWVDDTQVMEVFGRKAFVPKSEAKTEVTIYRVGVMDRLTKTCAFCADDFITYESLKAQRFCSRKCGDASRLAARGRTCEQCGTGFLAHGTRAERFCSKECFAESGWTEVPCGACGATFRRRKCHVKKVNYCTPKCRDSTYREKRNARPRQGGTCADCAGPTSKKQYTRCQTCKWKRDEDARRGPNLTRPSDHEITLVLTDQAVPF